MVHCRAPNDGHSLRRLSNQRHGAECARMSSNGLAPAALMNPGIIQGEVQSPILPRCGLGLSLEMVEPNIQIDSTPQPNFLQPEAEIGILKIPNHVGFVKSVDSIS